MMRKVDYGGVGELGPARGCRVVGFCGDDGAGRCVHHSRRRWADTTYDPPRPDLLQIIQGQTAIVLFAVGLPKITLADVAGAHIVG